MVSYLCKCIGVSKSGYYNYFNNDKIREIKERNDERDFKLILKAYKFKKDKTFNEKIWIKMSY